MSNQKPKLVNNAKPKVQHTMVINAMSDGNIVVKGIVPEMNANLNLLAAAVRAVADLFCRAAMEGRASADSPIIKPVGSLVVPGMGGH